ncbi:SCNNA protein, partial [Chloropsis hardwickii]|nr:SCNNA protein [Chloropsis hardwickii]
EGLIEFYGSFREMFEFFCQHTTIHGTIRLVCSGRNRLKTAFWTLLLLASLAMLYWQFALMLSQFWAYPVVLTMSMHSEPKMFPAVTICNLDPYRFELVSEQLEQLERMAEESLTFLYGPKASARWFHLRDKDTARDGDKDTAGDMDTDKDMDMDTDRARTRASRGQGQANFSSAGFRLNQNFSLVRMWDPRAGKNHSRVGFRLCNSTGGSCFYSWHSSGLGAVLEWFRFHYTNLMAQLGPSPARPPQHIQDLVYSCQYHGQPCRPSDYVHFHHPVFGSCYTFNSKGTDPFWTATKPGIPYGLSLILRAEQREHIPLLATVAGVKVMIHSHNQTPFLEHEGFHIRPGIATTIAIRQLHPRHSEFTFIYPILFLLFSPNTSALEMWNFFWFIPVFFPFQACLHSCFQHAMLRRCGCGYFYYPLPAGARYCDYSRQPAWGHCFYQLYSQLRNHRLDCFQHCPKPCRRMEFSPWSSSFPGVPSLLALIAFLKSSAVRNSWGIFGQSLGIPKKGTKTPKQREPRPADIPGLLQENLLLSGMGSQWSLWFGSSVLSVVEMLELLLDTLVLALLFCFQRLRAGSGPGTPPNAGREPPGDPRGLREE